MAWEPRYKRDLLSQKSYKENESHSSENEYETPPLSDLQRLLWINRSSTGSVNEVWPNLYLGDATAARDKGVLLNLGITHILNAADGKFHINTGPRFYRDMQVEYYGIEADDDPAFDMSIHFRRASQFIRSGLNSQKGKVLVHCAMGISRSAALVLAYLLLHENLTLVDAIQTVCKHRDICPNSGFMSQLRELDIKLAQERKMRRDRFRV
ncbi:dual specificity protein phosphatase 13-like [Protopterus annectens]|uniref:dual specificity protein phosphatase 13-like n=1 Tax=Protopterus annectens TaxID=7888 RepID=UPI001CFAD3E6|nr:dual specificity protein phosphatase 13-like [Protopterus annectens]